MNSLVINDLRRVEPSELAAAEMTSVTGGVGPAARIGIRFAVKAFIDAYENPISVNDLLTQGKDQLTSSQQ